MMLAFELYIAAVTLLQFFAYGAANRLIGPAVGFFVAISWIIFCLFTEQHGLQVLNVSLLGVHAYNFWKHFKEEARFWGGIHL